MKPFRSSPLILFIVCMLASPLIMAEIPIVTIPIPTSTGGGSTIIINGSANHNDLQNIQGGSAGDYYHLTNAEWVNRIFLYNQTTPAITYFNNFVTDANSSWTSTYNSTYATWAYNQTPDLTPYAKYNFTSNNFNGTGNFTTLTINTGLKHLIDSSGYVAVNWEAKHLRDNANVLSIDYENRNLLDIAEVGSIYWDDRELRLNWKIVNGNFNLTGNNLTNIDAVCNDTTCWSLEDLNKTGTSGTDTWALNYTAYYNRTDVYNKSEVYNKTEVDTKIINNASYFATYNATYASLLNQNCDTGFVVNGTYFNGSLRCTAQSSGNASWNESRADGLYYPLNTNPKNYINQTQTDVLYYPLSNPNAYTNESYWGKNLSYLYPKGNENVYANRLEVGNTNRLFEVVGFFKSPDTIFSCAGTLEGCENLTGTSSCNNVSGCNWEQSISCGNNPQLDCSIYNEGECLAKNQSFCSPTYNAACAGTRDCTIQSGDKGWCDTHTDLCLSSGNGCESTSMCEVIGNEGDCLTASCYWNGASCETTSSCTAQSTSSGCLAIAGCGWTFACNDYAGRYCTDGWSQSTCSQYTSIGCYWNDGFNTCSQTGGTGSCPNIPVDVCLDYNGCNLTGSEEFNCLGSILDTSCGQLGQADCTSANTTGYCSTQLLNNTETITAQAGVGQTNDTYACLDATGNKNWYSDYQCNIHSVLSYFDNVEIGNATITTLNVATLNADTLNLNNSVGLTGNYTLGECWQTFKGGILIDTNCTAI